MQHHFIKHSSREQTIYQLAGLNHQFVEHCNQFGKAYLMASVHGADIAVKTHVLSPEKLNEDDLLTWPEAGIRLKTVTLDSVYSKKKSMLGSGTIECDFQEMPNGFSIVCIPEYFNQLAFDLIVETHAKDQVRHDDLQKKRKLHRPKFDSCPCCRNRSEKVRKNPENHPASLILKRYLNTNQMVEFHVASQHVDMVCAYHIEDISHWNGELTCMGGDHVVRLDLTMIHTIQIAGTVKRGQECSVMRLYHSLGGVMLEVCVPGKEHAQIWHHICASDETNYRSMGGDSPYSA